MPPEKSKTTIYDVASRAGVAISTVSRVLNGSHDVSDGTRVRVLEAVRELSFRPDRTAKSLAHKGLTSLCVALPSFTTPFHTELLKGVRARLRDLEVDLLLCDLGSATPAETLLSFLQRGTVDGLLLAGMPVTEDLAAELRALHAPVVLVGHEHPEFDAFLWDDDAGARAATAYLAGLGHRRIGLIKAHSVSRLQAGRMQGYREALDTLGLAYDPTLIQSGVTEKHAGFSEEAGYEAMQALLAAAPDVTAVFACSDVQAFGALLAAREAGRRVPEDLSLVGYDDIKVSRYVGLSSVDQKMLEVGTLAAGVLVERVQRKRQGPPETVTIIPELRPRITSGAPL
ncbi:MAG TPA: LacI family DNA-binding transcriptional regulator [Rhodothermales bacterium]|nr:LacI family DNA-binding transcriptional regulator [Rhodothermales bacterium]